MNQKYYKCNHCGQIITKIKDTSVPVICCGSPMTEIEAGTVEASVEKHETNGNKVIVKVGSVTHPMTPEHYIEWVSLETNKGVKLHKLTPNTNPETQFMLDENEEVISILAYCNLHGLWKA